jgi:hypothetical protein
MAENSPPEKGRDRWIDRRQLTTDIAAALVVLVVIAAVGVLSSSWIVLAGTIGGVLLVALAAWVVWASLRIRTLGRALDGLVSAHDVLSRDVDAQVRILVSGGLRVGERLDEVESVLGDAPPRPPLMSLLGGSNPALRHRVALLEAVALPDWLPRLVQWAESHGWTVKVGPSTLAFAKEGDRFRVAVPIPRERSAEVRAKLESRLGYKPPKLNVSRLNEDVIE